MLLGSAVDLRGLQADRTLQLTLLLLDGPQQLLQLLSRGFLVFYVGCLFFLIINATLVSVRSSDVHTSVPNKSRAEEHFVKLGSDVQLECGHQHTRDTEGDQEGDQEGEVVRLRGECLQQLAAGEVSGPGMNWYLTEDLVMRGLEVRPYTEAKQARILSGDIM